MKSRNRKLKLHWIRKASIHSEQTVCHGELGFLAFTVIFSRYSRGLVDRALFFLLHKLCFILTWSRQKTTVWWCSSQRYRPLTCNATAFESSQRLRLSIKYDLTWNNMPITVPLQMIICRQQAMHLTFVIQNHAELKFNTCTNAQGETSPSSGRQYATVVINRRRPERKGQRG